MLCIFMLKFTAWTDVHSAQEEVKRIRDNEFRGEHPHLAEWKEVSHADQRTSRR